MKELKKEFKKKASETPDKYYPTQLFKKLGLNRQKCKETGTYFWSETERKYCGEPELNEGFTFFENNPCKKKYSYSELWNAFKNHLEKRKYTAIKRYPVVARWRDDTDFVQASIYNFQPYVVNGSVKPPANPLVVPQLCLRFNDIDNVGVTMSHFTSFDMIGQHAFTTDNWNQEKYFEDLFTFFTDELGIDKSELIIHEDAWAGGGNYGPCVEIFCRGIELANQVYMLYEQTEEGNKELEIKVLDMGMGHERVTWFTQGNLSAYDATFPETIKQVMKKLNITIDNKFFEKYLQYGAFLNVDEVDDLEKAWKEVAIKMDVSYEKLRNQMLPLTHLYSIIEHTRTLLIAISDGALPSNVKGGYNLRILLRRALNIIEQNNWDIELGEIAQLHANELKSIYPELESNIDHVKKILQVEKDKHKKSKKNSQKILKQELKKGKPTTEELINLYKSHGITPEDVLSEAKKLDMQVHIPNNFYLLVSEQETGIKKTKKDTHIDLNAPPTIRLYYEHHDLLTTESHVIAVKQENDHTIIALDKSPFYPTSGGQLNDTGKINDIEVFDVTVQGQVVLHKLKKCNLEIGQKVHCKVDSQRRMQLTAHHSATHIMTGTCKEILGKHIWQAGANKTLEKARLDITHYETLTQTQLEEIESRANEIINENRPIISKFMKRDVAEAQHGVTIYQGGAVPGNKLRIVEINDFDVEACGGTHFNVTSDIELMKILKTSKLQDGVLRIEFVAGQKAIEYVENKHEELKKIAKKLECNINQIGPRAYELFSKWKKIKKNKLQEFKFEVTDEGDSDPLQEAAKALKTQPEHVNKTITKFLDDIKGKLKK